MDIDRTERNSQFLDNTFLRRLATVTKCVRPFSRSCQPRRSPVILRSRSVDGFQVSEIEIAETTDREPVSRLGWLTLVVSGSLSERIGERSQTYQAGDVVLRTRVSRASLCAESGKARVITIEPGSRRYRSLRPLLPLMGSPIRIHAEMFDGIVARIVRDLSSAAPWSETALSSSVLELFVEISRLLSRQSPRCVLPDWLRRAVRLLERHFAEPISLTDVARAVGVHPVRLAQEFRRLRGCSMGVWLRRQRISASMEQLMSSTESVRTIARRAGFHDSSHLIREFRRVTGMTPGAFRRSGH